MEENRTLEEKKSQIGEVVKMHVFSQMPERMRARFRQSVFELFGF